MCSGHSRLCVYVTVCVSVCLSVPRHIVTLFHGHGNGKWCPLVVHCCADLQSVHGFRCYDNIAPNAKCQRVLVLALCLVTFRVRRSRGEMYIDHGRQCVFVSACVSVCPRRMPTLLHGPGCNLRNGRGCPLVHYWADLQSVHGFRCCDNIAANAKRQRVRALALRPVLIRGE